MHSYEVGGAVRDALLGLPIVERDYVVVGATPADMAAAGFTPVGKDFPVFLHPVTHAEYALARTERKTAAGYHGFAFHTGPDVTLEDDLRRRDLTVNAIARTDDGTLVDPWGGQRDLAARVLRHVSAAFAEDPVRILRVARFATRFAPLGFTIAPETLALMQRMVENGEADHLVPERVWKEAARTLSGDARATSGYQPSVFFRVLRECGALARVMPELDALAGIPQPVKYHPEIDAFEHVMLALDLSFTLGCAPETRTAVLLHDLGKALSPKAELPHHHGHEARGVPLVEAFCARLRVPNAHRELAVAVTRDHLNVHRVARLRPETLLGLLERLRAFKRGDFFAHALDACQCDARGRAGLQGQPYPSVGFLKQAAAVAAEIQARDLDPTLQGPAIGAALRTARIERLAAWKAQTLPTPL
ncbi:MAG: multifunctional CCA addition/repair protein [Nevskiaceae bacterium]|nr:MAG: multifunctional CCA addition/repair protein [Nevskiaceae bacterium]TBR74472.1 MAG: multifunctional CCA addition/repair protein [Nevskiaceae bacterium]